MTRHRWLLTAAMVLPVALFAQAANSNSFIGTWKLNVAKSKFKPGPAMKSETVTIPEQGRVHVQQVTADGQEVDWSYDPSNGTAVPIKGMDGQR